MFGLQWLRKAILRASGFKALHDEEAIYRREAAQAAAAGGTTRASMDWYSFTVAFKGVLLEGLEVAFIVVTFGSNQGNIPLAAAGAVTAIVVVAIVGLRVRAPLGRVPENTMKYAVGLLLTTFGTFWAAEGAGVSWPGSDLALLVLLAFYAGASLDHGQAAHGQARGALPARGPHGGRRMTVTRVVRPVPVRLRDRRRLDGSGRRRGRRRTRRTARPRRVGGVVAAAAGGGRLVIPVPVAWHAEY